MEPMLAEFAEVAEASTFSEPTHPDRLHPHRRARSRRADRPRLLGRPRPRGGALRRRGRDPRRARAHHLPRARPRRRALARWRAAPPATPSAPSSPTLREAAPRPRPARPPSPQPSRAGAAVDWGAFFAAPAPSASPLPTYPFQRQRYWLGLRRRRRRRRRDSGSGRREHPLLGAAVALADGERAAAHRPPLPRHPSLAGRPRRRSARCCCPAPPSSSWRCRAGEQVGAERVEELTLQAPLVLPADGAVQVQVVGRPAPTRPRAARRVHSRARPNDATPWTRHATRPCSRRRRRGRTAGLGVAARRRRAARRSTDLYDASPTRARLRPRLPGPDGGLAARRGDLRRGRPARGRAGAAASASTRRCSTRPCTPSACGRARPSELGCRSPGAGSPARGRREGAAGADHPAGAGAGARSHSPTAPARRWPRSSRAALRRSPGPALGAERALHDALRAMSCGADRSPAPARHARRRAAGPPSDGCAAATAPGAARRAPHGALAAVQDAGSPTSRADVPAGRRSRAGRDRGDETRPAAARGLGPGPLGPGRAPRAPSS